MTKLDLYDLQQLTGGESSPKPTPTPTPPPPPPSNGGGLTVGAGTVTEVLD